MWQTADASVSSVNPQQVVVNPTFGRMEEFTPGSDWRHYIERLEMFFEVNNVPNEKQVPCVLTLTTHVCVIEIYYCANEAEGA